MVEKVTSIALHVVLTTILFVASLVISDDTAPANKSQLDNWFNSIVKPYTQRAATLDHALVAAEKGAKVIKVSKTKGGNFNTVSDAIKSIPPRNTKRVIVHIGPGVYNERIRIDWTKRFVTFYGSPANMPTLTSSGTAAQYGTDDSATLVVESNYFVAANIILVNSAPRPGNGKSGGQALAIRIAGDKAAFYNCKFKGFQDTVCSDHGNHLFKNCYIEGTVDFIFGSGTSLYLNTVLNVPGDGGFTAITAHGELPSETNGFSFVHCSVTGTGNGTYLGRAWRPYSRVIFSYTTMSGIVNPLGWSDNSHPERDRTVYYGEYKCSGPGSDLSRRVPYTKKLSDNEARPFLALHFIQASSWLLPPPTL
ncbi:putative pectinesterase 63 [Corylus avellana]|uniref:putative pectinesterase 63 n=1 Tax=Corylus avellana TaxID=13451 RepID=UPI00286B2D9D|nr:putative pectinesterase 63 [Corylus avellana]